MSQLIKTSPGCSWETKDARISYLKGLSSRPSHTKDRSTTIRGLRAASATIVAAAHGALRASVA